MLSVIYVLVAFLLVSLSYSREKTIVTIPSLFTIIWCIGGLVLLNWHKLYTVENFIYMYIFIAIFAFNVVYHITYKKRRKHFNPSWNISENQYRLIIILHVICYVLMIPIFIAAIKIIQTFGWMEIRSSAYGESEIMSTFVFKLFTWFVSPVFTATILVSVISFISKSKHLRTLLIIGCFDVILVTISFGGRYAMVRMLVFVLSAYFLFMHLSGIRYRIKLKYAFLGVLVLYILFVMTSNRSLKDLSFTENIMAYFYGSFVYFQKIVTDNSFSSFHSQLQYGNETFGIITSIPQLLLYKITGVNNTPEFISDFATNDFIYIGPTVRYNAMTTALYPMWLDFRATGIVIGMGFLAYAYNFLRGRVITKKSMSSYAILIYLIFVILTTTLTYGLITVQHTIILFFIILFTYNAKVIKK